ncbi:hypothetical protein [Mangrovibacter phragmitis]|uniref:hypothetical protein n=1 Tax=Mangrovibacter phragmitis TaxID=1691903 RepID=UPI003519CD28
MFIQDEMIKGLTESTRPIIIYRYSDGTIQKGFVLRSDEFVASIATVREICQATGLQIVDKQPNHL